MAQGAKLLNPDKLLPRVGPKTFQAFVRLFPPIRNSGVKIVSIAPDWRTWELKLPLGLKTRNYVGTHFGGTLYSAADPFLMIAWMNILGKEWTVWDKAASIRFLKPGKGTLRSGFAIAQEEVDVVQAMESGSKRDLHYTLDWLDADGDVVASVDKTVHIRAP